MDTIHGVKVPDPYRWLEDQEAAETREWIVRQNEYTDRFLKDLPDSRAIKERVSELTKVDTVGIPTQRAGRYFFDRKAAADDLAVLYMREGLHGDDQILIDPHRLSPDHSISVSMADVSDDGTLLVYRVRLGGVDETSVRLFDVEKRMDLPDTLPARRHMSLSLTPDKKGLYYSIHDSDAGPRVMFHRIGDDPAEDLEIFGSAYGPEKIIVSALSDDGRYLVVTVLYGSAPKQTEIYLKDVLEDGPFEVVVRDVEARFEAEIAGEEIIIQTDWDAPNKRIFKTSVKQPGKENWTEIIPERQGSIIESIAALAGRVLVLYLKEVRPHLVLFDTEGAEERVVEFETIGSLGTAQWPRNSLASGSWTSPEIFFSFSSFHVPTTIYRYDIDADERKVWIRSEVPVESNRFEVKQVWFTSRDGTRVPMFLLHETDITLNGSNPVFLTGYGGFSLSRTPQFSTTAVVWAERGGVYALPSLRGGGEFGEDWHRAGMLENKQNVFDDFIVAAEWLVENGYGRPEKLAIAGGSNGGLLVGAAMTQRPELFRAVVCTYPLLDMVRYHLFLVARFWVPEYGSSEDPGDFKNLLAYSPYHNVVAGTEYPATLFITGDGDTRVAPLHARKMTALMQANNESKGPILLRYHIKAGHSGGQPVSERIRYTTEMLGFLLWQLDEQPQ